MGTRPRAGTPRSTRERSGRSLTRRPLRPRLGRVSLPQDPGHAPTLPPQRWLAVGGAALISMLSVTAAAGYGPGAYRGAALIADAPTVVSTARPDDEHASAAADGSDWLVLDDAAAANSSRGPEGRSPGAGSEPPTRSSTELPPHSGRGKRVVYDENAQRVWLVRADGSVARTYAVSGSRDPDLLDGGRYAVYSKSRHAVSLDHKETMNYMVRFATGRRAAIGFHDIPAHRDGTLAQSRDDLGEPRSAGCVRQWISDARALWEFTEVDTPVVVID